MDTEWRMYFHWEMVPYGIDVRGEGRPICFMSLLKTYLFHERSRAITLFSVIGGGQYQKTPMTGGGKVQMSVMVTEWRGHMASVTNGENVQPWALNLENKLMGRWCQFVSLTTKACAVQVGIEKQ